MDNKNPTLTNIVVACLAVQMLWLAGFALFLRNNGFAKYFGGNVDTLVNITTTHHIYDSTRHQIYIPIETPERIVQLPPESIPAVVDTNAILSAYFSQAIYQRQFNDSNLQATLIDTVSKNRLGAGAFTYKWLKPVTNITTTITTLQQAPGATQFFCGINLGMLPGARLQCGPVISVQQNKTLWGIGTSLTHTQPNLNFAFSKRIFKLKNKTKTP